MSESRGLRAGRLAMAGGLATMGVLHLIARPTFEAMIPKWLPGDPAAWNYAATAAELGSAGLLARRSTARAGGIVAFATLAVVWVANLQHVAQGGIYPGRSGVLGSPAVAWVRAPLQVPMLWLAWRIAQRSPARRQDRKSTRLNSS